MKSLVRWLTSSRLPWWAVGLIVISGLAVYSDSLTGPFVFDDGYVTTNNPSIRQLWPLSVPLSPPGDSTIGGRPLLNLSFAINYALGGLNPVGYHVVNLLVHLLAALTLLEVVRRTLVIAGVDGPPLGTAAATSEDLPSLPLSLAVALLWMVHPLQTESVTYISQRAESLMGLFYLLTIYCFLRSLEPKWAKLWSILCVTSCLLGMATKEVMVTAPLMVLIYDRTLVAGTFREAWRLRWKLYAGLMSAWLLLGDLLLDVGKRSVGTGLGVTPLSYAMTQCRAIIHYLVLVIWPHPLVIDYGTAMVGDPVSVWPQAMILILLLAVTIWAFFYRPVLGLTGAWFFIILAPTSSFIPLVLEPAAEHRMYLPLIAPLMLLVVGLYRWMGRHFFWMVGLLALVWGAVTFLRNDDYRSALALWQTTAAQCPNNARAHNNYGELLLQEGQAAEAGAQFREALRLKSDYPEAETNLGNALIQTGQIGEAIAHYQTALRIKPDNAAAENNWGNALRQEGQFSVALSHYQDAVRIDPGYVDAHDNLGNLLLKLGRISEAAAQYEEVVSIKPNDPEAHNNFGVVLAQMGRKAEAAAQFQEALRLDPSYEPASANLSQLEAEASH